MEMQKHKHGFIVGVFIMLAVAIFVITVFTLGGERKSFSKKFYVKVLFNEINGLKEGNNVWFDGVKIGTVKKIALVAPSKVEVILNIEKKAQPFIKQNALAKISSDGFLGNKIVIIYGGTNNVSVVENNAYLHVQKDTLTNEDMLATLQASNTNLLEITNNIKAITQQIKDGRGTVGKLINDSSVADNLQAAIRDFKNITKKGKSTMANVENFTTGLHTKNSSLNKLIEDTVMYDSIRLAVVQLKSTIQKANNFVQNMHTLSGNLLKISANLSDTTNTAGLLLNDKQMADDLQLIFQNLKTSSKKLDEDLEALQHNFLLKHYFKKNKPLQK